MGIQGLLPFLKDATHRVNVRKYSGYTVAVDTYCWIHRGAFGCATQLAKGEQTDMYVRYCLKFINMLRSMDIKPILVFDGSHLPAKKAVEDSRRERRELYSKKGRQFLREGKVSEARDCFTKCVNVTPHMALEVMKVARSLGVDCIVAPYEADAQLAYLATSGIVQAVITEDSDLVAFGCPRIIYKLDLNGNGLEIEASRLNQAMKMGDRFSMDKFRYMCIASGCDYLASLPGIGLGKARKLFQTATNPDITHVLKRLPMHLKMKVTVPPEYINGFHQANNTFLYQLAFDPIKRKLVPVHPYSADMDRESLTYAGSYYPSDQALQQALGNIDPNTKKQIFDFQPEYRKAYDKSVPRHSLSIWHKDYRPGPDFSEGDPLEVQRHTTNGKEVALAVSGLKLDRQHRKRPRPDVDGDTPTNEDLTSIYGSPNAKRHSAGQTLVVPETPESEDKVAAKPSPRQRNPFSKAGSHNSSPPKRVAGFGAEERVVKTLSRRNIFAKGRAGTSSRLDVLSATTVVKSRFFANKPEHKTQETAEDAESGIKEDSLPRSPSSPINEFSGSDNETNDDDDDDMSSIINTTHRMTSEEVPEHSAKSTLSRLQRFQRAVSAPALPFSRSLTPTLSSEECTMGSAADSLGVSGMSRPEFDQESDRTSSQESSQISQTSVTRETSQSKTGAFSWSRSRTSVTSLKREGSARTFRSLSDFRRKTVTARLDHGSSQTQKDLAAVESSLDDMLQGSCNLTFASQQSNLCSIDTDSFTLSQLSSQSYMESSSQKGDSQMYDFEVGMNSSQNESLQRQSQNDGFSVGEKELQQREQHCPPDDMRVDKKEPPEKKNNTQPVQEVLPRPGPSSNLDILATHLEQIQKSDASTNGLPRETEKDSKMSESEERTSLGGESSNQEDRESPGGETVSSLQEEDKEFVDLTSESDENAPETDEVRKQTPMRQLKKKMKSDADLENTPTLPTLPKLKPDSTKLSQCKASGLSRRQKNKQTPKADENKGSGPRQQTLFAFMKKNHERRKETNPTMPLSPSKQNIVGEVTPEGDNSLCSKGIVRVQRSIFK